LPLSPRLAKAEVLARKWSELKILILCLEMLGLGSALQG
jgi:hypothetical protein